MEIIDIPRGMGKTSYLIHKSNETEYPILVATESQKKVLIAKAKSYKITIPEPITINNFIKINETGRDKPEAVLIDELPIVLNTFLGVNVKIATMTSDSKKEL